MQAFKKVSAFITLSALSLSSAWAADDIAFVATVELDGFQVIPPVLTSKRGEVCLEFGDFETLLTTTATGEVVARILAGNPGRVQTTGGFDEAVETNNIRLYFGQPFANGRPIATLCDNAIKSLECNADTQGDVTVFNIGSLRLRDIHFQGQQLRTLLGGTLIISGIGAGDQACDVKVDDVTDCPDKHKRIIVTELELIKFLIERGLIYMVFNSNFTASKAKSRLLGGLVDILRYQPPKRGTIGDGEIRGTLGLAPEGSRCPPPEPDT